LYKEDFNTVTGAKVVLHFVIPIGDLRLYLPNLSKLNLPNCTVPRPWRLYR